MEQRKSVGSLPKLFKRGKKATIHNIKLRRKKTLGELSRDSLITDTKNIFSRVAKRSKMIRYKKIKLPPRMTNGDRVTGLGKRSDVLENRIRKNNIFGGKKIKLEGLQSFSY